MITITRGTLEAIESCLLESSLTYSSEESYLRLVSDKNSFIHDLFVVYQKVAEQECAPLQDVLLEVDANNISVDRQFGTITFEASFESGDFDSEEDYEEEVELDEFGNPVDDWGFEEED